MDFSGKRVLITGGTRGIGRATVAAFLRSGARVAVNGRNPAAVAQVVADLDAGSRAAPAPGDLGSVVDCERVVAAAVAALGGLDILVNNAGSPGLLKPIEAVTPDEFDRTMSVNLRAVYFCTKYAVPALRASGGNIVNVASILGLRGSGTGDSVYCASKGAVVNLTRDLAIELGPTIRVNCVCPGAIDTEMLQDLGRHLGNGVLEAGYEMLSAKSALKRVARADEIASTILYLASDAASFVTGSIHVADGGTLAIA